MARKRVLIVVGSPRKKGNSATLAKEVAAGAEEKGAELEFCYLHDMKIQPCSACDGCQDEAGKECVIEDDMQALYPKLIQADVLVIASPIYWFTVSSQTKLFMDRWYALRAQEYAAFARKRIGIVLTYADMDPFSSGAVNALRTFQDAFHFLGSKIVGMVYGSASAPGEVRNNPDLMKRARELGKELCAESD